MTRKSAPAVLMALVLLLTLTGCTAEQALEPSPSPLPTPSPSSTPEPEPTAIPKRIGVRKRIGVSMPTRSLKGWDDGDNMKNLLESAGYSVDLQYGGDNDVPTQIAQIENMIAYGVDVLVIAAIDGGSLMKVLEVAKEKGIPVIAYDRLIMDSDAVNYYVTFDNFDVGVKQGEFVRDMLGLDNQVGPFNIVKQGEFVRDMLDLDNQAGPFNIEIFDGDPGDCNAIIFYNGHMSILKPYIDSGKLVVKSGQTEFTQVATASWSTQNAQARMENLISAQGYSPTGTKLDAVVCANDSTAQGVTNALKAAGYTAENFPIITGQDCEKPSVINMKEGTQSMSIFKETRTLAAHTVTMVDAIVRGEAPEVNDTKTYDNGTGIIPSYLCESVVVTKDNIYEILINSYYYTEADITP